MRGAARGLGRAAPRLEASRQMVLRIRYTPEGRRAAGSVRLIDAVIRIKSEAKQARRGCLDRRLTAPVLACAASRTLGK